jgi:hypothetical protein
VQRTGIRIDRPFTVGGYRFTRKGTLYQRHLRRPVTRPHGGIVRVPNAGDNLALLITALHGTDIYGLWWMVPDGMRR